MTHLRSLDTAISESELLNFSALLKKTADSPKCEMPPNIWTSGDIPWLCHLSIPTRFNLLIILSFIVCGFVGAVYSLGEWRIDQTVISHAQYQRQADMASELRVLGLGMETDTARLMSANDEQAMEDFHKRAKQAEDLLIITDSKSLKDGFSKTTESFTN
jgi:hypothetical protein